MKKPSVLFLIQNFEVKSFDDCAGYREIVKPVLASGLITDYRILFYEKSHSMILPALERRLNSYSEEFANQPIVVYGAGLHTQGLLEQLAKFNVVAIADRDATLWGNKLWNIPVIRPDQIADYAGVVLISSRAFEDAIYKELSVLLDPGTVILPLYKNLFDLSDWHQLIADEVNQELVTFKPDILFFSPSHPDENLDKMYFKQFKSILPSLKVVTLWWDYDDQSESSSYLSFEKDSLEYSDLVIENTNTTRLPGMRQRQGVYCNHEGAEKVLFHPSVPDPALFHYRNVKKIYDVALFGSSAGRRKEWIEFLKKNLGTRFHHIGGVVHDDKTLPMEEYAIAMSQSRIIVNTQTYSFRQQCKGRVREVLALGGCLFEEDNDETRGFCSESESIITYFRSKEELINKLEYALNNPDYIATRSVKGLDWMSQNRTPQYWTKRIISFLYDSGASEIEVD